MEIWEKEKSYYKVMNMENPGNDIEISFNGKIFQIQHGATVLIPDAVANALNETVMKQWKVEGKMGEQRSMVAVDVARMMAIKTSGTIKDENNPDKEDVKNSIMAAKFAKRKNEADE